MPPVADVTVPGTPLSRLGLPRVAAALAVRCQGLAGRTPSDLSATNLWLFRRVHDWRLVEGEWPAVGGLSYDGRRFLLPLFDPLIVPADRWRPLLLGHEGLFPLTAGEAAALASRGWRVESNDDDADYVYAASALRDYRGAALHAKRNLVQQCEDGHRLRATRYDPALHRPSAVDVLEGWCRDKGQPAEGADAGPCREALADAAALGLDGWLFEADDEPAGFLLTERVQPEVLVVRFAKARTTVKGLSPTMFRHLAREAPAGVEWINFEQDLGIPGFRQSKQSFQPALRVAKYRAMPPTA